MKTLNIITLSFSLSVIINLVIKVEYDLLSGGDTVTTKGIGFPFVWNHDSLSTSMETIIYVPAALLNFTILSITIAIFLHVLKISSFPRIVVIPLFLLSVGTLSASFFCLQDLYYVQDFSSYEKNFSTIGLGTYCQ